MPVEVPKEPKNYTTVYDNFKGVDFTNDASNVYRRRSPTGLNMLPDLDGRPYKRTGWEVVVPPVDFAKAYGVEDFDSGETYSVGDYAIYENVAYVCEAEISTPGEWDESYWSPLSIEPGRIHHFTYGGLDYLMIFNSLGVFWMKQGDLAITLAQLATGSEAAPVPGEFPPTVERGGVEVKLSADQNRAFFFEGGGTAGFYVFVDNYIYRFSAADSGDMYFWFVEPKIPVILIGTEPSSGTGTVNQAVNLLTEKRAVQYFGDGNDTYVLPSSPDSADDVSVEVIDSETGKWTTETNWTLSDNIVTFTAGHLPPASTIDNVRITYIPGDGTTYALEHNTQTGKKKIEAAVVEHWYRHRLVTKKYEYNKTTKKWVLKNTSYSKAGKWTKASLEEATDARAKLDAPGIYNRGDFTVYSNITGTYASTSCTKTWYPYADSVAVQFDGPKLARSYGKKTTSAASAWSNPVYGSASSSLEFTPTTKIVMSKQEQRRTVTYSKTFSVYGAYTKIVPVHSDAQSRAVREAFMACRKSLTFGNNIYNQVFISASTTQAFRNRVWYCAANDPSYFPDINYIEVGADDKEVMGLIKIGSYLGVVKAGSGTQSSVYLAYATSFEEDSTYAVKQSVSGIGAISTGAFNILNEEPLFLSNNGVVGIEVSESDINKQIRNRSFYVNKALMAENDLSSAISYVYNGLYYLGINNHCYVLDGSQKTSWANEKTNLQYECYFLDNIPAQCFADMDGRLFFTDFNGAVCRFKKAGEPLAYVDDYYVGEAEWIASKPPDSDEFDIDVLGGASEEYGLLANSDDDYLCVYPDGTTIYDPDNRYSVGDYVLYEDRNVYVCIEDILTPEEWTPEHWEELDTDRLMVMVGKPDINATVSYMGDFYTVIETYTDGETKKEKAIVSPGVPITAEWSTISDDDDMVHFFKNLRKKGCVVSLLPGQGSYVQILIRPDEKDPVDLGRIEAGITELPADLIVKKKIKKYKRLQFIVRDDWYDDGFALDQIIKTYTVGNYSKNRK